MIKYRPQRGSLEEAMKEYREFDTIDEMFDFIIKDWSWYIMCPFTKEDLSIGEDLSIDSRIGWSNTHYILTNRILDRNFIEMYGVPQCIGWCCIED